MTKRTPYLLGLLILSFLMFMVVLVSKRVSDQQTSFEMRPQAAPSAVLSFDPAFANIPQGTSTQVGVFLTVAETTFSSLTLEFTVPVGSNNFTIGNFTPDPELNQSDVWNYSFANTTESNNVYTIKIGMIYNSTNPAPAGTYRLGSFSVTSLNNSGYTAPVMFSTNPQNNIVLSTASASNLLTYTSNAVLGQYTTGLAPTFTPIPTATSIPTQPPTQTPIPTATVPPSPTPTTTASLFISFTPQGNPGANWNLASEILSRLQSFNYSPVYISAYTNGIGWNTHYYNSGTNDFPIVLGQGYIIGVNNLPAGQDLYSLFSFAPPTSLNYNLAAGTHLIGIPPALLGSLTTGQALCNAVSGAGGSLTTILTLNAPNANTYTTYTCGQNASQLALNGQTAYQINLSTGVNLSLPIIVPTTTLTPTSTPTPTPTSTPTPSPTPTIIPSPTPILGVAQIQFRATGINHTTPSLNADITVTNIATNETYPFGPTLISDNTGLYQTALNPLPAGTYQLCIKIPSYLRRCTSATATPANRATHFVIDATHISPMVDFATYDINHLVAGDINGDNAITVEDQQQILNFYNRPPTDVFNKPAPLGTNEDVNKDGYVNIIDIALATYRFTDFTIPGN